MNTTINFPNVRLETAGTGNPIFVTDIMNACESALSVMESLLGLPSNGFAIITGFVYGGGAYTGGLVYMNGVFYWCTAGLTENKYLMPDNVDDFVKIYQDANTHATYKLFYAVESNTPVGGMPQFVGNMNAYRLNLTVLKGAIAAAIVTAEAYTDSEITALNLGNSSTLDVGTTTGTVCAGDDGRLSNFRSVDRGEAGLDFVISSFDLAWHILDLSSIVTNSNAKFVILRVGMVQTSGQTWLQVRREGGTSTGVAGKMVSFSSTYYIYADMIIPLNNRQIEWSVDNTTASVLNFCVAGWF
jgi:hypothetical protein